jgi:hypothetical protein
MTILWEIVVSALGQLLPIADLCIDNGPLKDMWMALKALISDPAHGGSPEPSAALAHVLYAVTVRPTTHTTRTWGPLVAIMSARARSLHLV